MFVLELGRWPVPSQSLALLSSAASTTSSLATTPVGSHFAFARSPQQVLIVLLRLLLFRNPQPPRSSYNRPDRHLNILVLRLLPMQIAALSMRTVSPTKATRDARERGWPFDSADVDRPTGTAISTRRRTELDELFAMERDTAVTAFAAGETQVELVDKGGMAVALPFGFAFGFDLLGVEGDGRGVEASAAMEGCLVGTLKRFDCCLMSERGR